MRNLACGDSEEISQEITNNWVHVSSCFWGCREGGGP